jgi:hypothetical protein
MIAWKNAPEDERGPVIPNRMMGLSGQSYQKTDAKWGFSLSFITLLLVFPLIETVVPSTVSMYDCLTLNPD